MNVKLNPMGYSKAIRLYLSCMGGKGQSEQLVYTLTGPPTRMKSIPKAQTEKLLAEHVWPSFNRRSVYRHLRRMQEDGELEREFHASLGRPKSFYVHPAIYAKLRGEPLLRRIIRASASSLFNQYLFLSFNPLADAPKWVENALQGWFKGVMAFSA